MSGNMHLTLWQQFSSNHSGSFTIVGVFDTEDHAAQAAHEAQSILRSIGDYWEDLSQEDRDEMYRRVERHGLMPIEEVLKQKYGVTWSNGLDWVQGFSAEELVKAVRLDGRNVRIAPLTDTWSGGEPFTSLLKQRGAVVGESYEADDGGEDDFGNFRGVMTFTCSAPDAEAVSKLLADVVVDTAIENEAQGLDSEINDVELDDEDDFASAHADDIVIAGQFHIERRKIWHDELYMVYEFYQSNQFFSAFPAFIDYLKQNGCSDIRVRYWTEVDGQEA